MYNCYIMNMKMSSYSWMVLILYILESNIVSSFHKLELRMPDISPKKKETYMCTYKKLPRGTSYAVKFEPLADQSTAHHMLVFACLRPRHFRKTWECEQSSPCAGTEEIIYAWAKNAPSLKLPNRVGFRLGASSDLRYLVAQVHYARPLKENETDNSGVSILLTHTRQKYLAGIYLFSSGDFAIPPKAHGYHVDVACMYTSSPIKSFAYRTHAHARGRVISAYRIRDGEWKLIGKGDPQKPQAFYPIAKSKQTVIKSGDVLAARCTFDSPNATKTIHSGAYSTDEMCNFYMMYYRVNRHHSSFPQSECDTTASSEFPKGSDTLPGSVVSILKPTKMKTMETKTSNIPTTMKSFHTTKKSSRTTKKSSRTTKKQHVAITLTEAHTKQITKAPEILTGPKPVLQQNWNIPPWTSFGHIYGMAMYDKETLVVLHEANWPTNLYDFDDENVFTSIRKGPIARNTVVHINAESGHATKTWGKNLFYLPYGLTIDHDGNFWITDLALHQVFKFAPNNLKKASLKLGKSFIPGSDKKHFCKPTSVAIETNGNIFVADGYCNSRIVQFSANGKFLNQWGIPNQNSPPGPKQLNVPHDLSLDHENHHLYVCDGENGRIQKIDSKTGRFLMQVKHKEFGDRLYGVVYNKAYGGILYVVSGTKNKNDIAKGFTIDAHTGIIINTWSTLEQASHCLTVSNDDMLLYTANKSKVLKFQVTNPQDTLLHGRKPGRFPWKEITATNRSNDEITLVDGEADDTSMVPAVVVVIVLATPIVLVLVAATIQHMRFQKRKNTAVKRLHNKKLNVRKHQELCFGCCFTPKYYLDSKRGFDKLVENLSDEDEEDELFTRKANGRNSEYY